MGPFLYSSALHLFQLEVPRGALTSKPFPRSSSPQKIRFNNPFPKAYSSEFKTLKVPIKAAPDELKGLFILEGNLDLNRPPTT
ncbi:uncharacterized protein IAS62_004353 [Cryptococcus decagattii]|uniref:Uncharacterized protein n=1 Tax=Cryptococcus decagattii TaxID=1859122 RepID=A0ABZ2AYR3_9TREE